MTWELLAVLFLLGCQCNLGLNIIELLFPYCFACSLSYYSTESVKTLKCSKIVHANRGFIYIVLHLLWHVFIVIMATFCWILMDTFYTLTLASFSQIHQERTWDLKLLPSS